MTSRLRAFGPPFLFAALFAGVLPWWIACPGGGPGARLCLLRAAGGGLAAILGAVLCARAALLSLRYAGTPLHPFATPKRLLLQGPYGRTRNPYYLGILTMIAGEALAWWSAALLVYALLLALAFHVLVVAVEEPRLRRRLGEVYDLYRARVPRWLPARRGARGPGTG